MIIRLILIFAGLSGALAVLAGAAAAHGLSSRLSEYGLELMEKAVRYQMWHALALLALGLALSGGFLRGSAALWQGAGLAWMVGTIAFSGSLYLLALTSFRFWPMITPIGGLSFVVGWLLIAAAAVSTLRVG